MRFFCFGAPKRPLLWKDSFFFRSHTGTSARLTPKSTAPVQTNHPGPKDTPLEPNLGGDRRSLEVSTDHGGWHHLPDLQTGKPGGGSSRSTRVHQVHGVCGSHARSRAWEPCARHCFGSCLCFLVKIHGPIWSVQYPLFTVYTCFRISLNLRRVVGIMFYNDRCL